MAKCRRREIYGVIKWVPESDTPNVTVNEATGNGILNKGGGEGTELVSPGDYVITDPRTGIRTRVHQVDFDREFEMVSEAVANKTANAPKDPKPEAPAEDEPPAKTVAKKKARLKAVKDAKKANGK